jgi:signal transduction histidine kinase
LTNAIKFGRNQPIEINVRQTPTAVQLEVADHGIGIPADRQLAVFDRFQRAVSSRHFAGLGLGLFISRQIVEAHGGRLCLESQPGVGSTFRVELPPGGVRS